MKLRRILPFARRSYNIVAILLFFLVAAIVYLGLRSKFNRGLLFNLTSAIQIDLPKAVHGRRCFISMLAGKKSIFPATVLFHRLLKIHKGLPICIVALVDAEVMGMGGELFELLGVQLISTVSKDFFTLPYKPERIKTMLRDQILWNKLRAWDLVEYERLVFLDIDIVILSPINELLEMDATFAGVPVLYDDEKILFKGPVKPNQGDPLNPDSWKLSSKFENPTLGHDGLNAGVMVLKPDHKVYKELLEAALLLEERLCCPLQEFLYRFFEFRGQYLRISDVYNMRKFRDSSKAKVDQVKIYHFVERRKPWMLGRFESKDDSFAKIWWNHADGMIKDIDAHIFLIPHLKKLLKVSLMEAAHSDMTHSN